MKSENTGKSKYTQQHDEALPITRLALGHGGDDKNPPPFVKPSDPPPSPSRMEPAVYLPQTRRSDVSIDFRRADVGVAEQFLNDPQVGPVLQ